MATLDAHVKTLIGLGKSPDLELVERCMRDIQDIDPREAAQSLELTASQTHEFCTALFNATFSQAGYKSLSIGSTQLGTYLNAVKGKFVKILEQFMAIEEEYKPYKNRLPTLLFSAELNNVILRWDDAIAMHWNYMKEACRLISQFYDVVLPLSSNAKIPASEKVTKIQQLIGQPGRFEQLVSDVEKAYSNAVQDLFSLKERYGKWAWEYSSDLSNEMKSLQGDISALTKQTKAAREDFVKFSISAGGSHFLFGGLASLFQVSSTPPAVVAGQINAGILSADTLSCCRKLQKLMDELDAKCNALRGIRLWDEEDQMVNANKQVALLCHADLPCFLYRLEDQLDLWKHIDSDMRKLLDYYSSMDQSLAAVDYVALFGIDYEQLRKFYEEMYSYLEIYTLYLDSKILQKPRGK